MLIFFAVCYSDILIFLMKMKKTSCILLWITQPSEMVSLYLKMVNDWTKMNEFKAALAKRGRYSGSYFLNLARKEEYSYGYQL